MTVKKPPVPLSRQFDDELTVKIMIYNKMVKLKVKKMKAFLKLRNVATIVACLAATTLFSGCDKEDGPNNGTEKPDAVMNLTATAGNAQISLAWDAPSENGGEEITGYEVTADNWANKVTKTASERSHTYTGLTNGTEYTFKVRAVNANGAGAESAAKATPTASSSNLGAWTEVANTAFGTKAIIQSIACGNGKFVAVGVNNDANGALFKMAYSADGINWTAIENTGLIPQSVAGIPFYNTVNDVAYGNGKFVAVTENNQIAYSTDGINWTASGASGFLPTISNGLEYTAIKSVVYGNGKFVIGGVTGGQPSGNHPNILCGAQMAYSSDGVNWTSINTTAFGFNLGYTADETYIRVDRLFFENGIFFAGEAKYGKMAYSTDGVNWTAMPNLTYAYALAYGNNKFVANLGNNFKIASSVDGINWTENNTDQKCGFFSMIYANGKFAATDVGFQVWTSTDGIMWNPNEVYNSGSYVIEDIVYGGGKFVVAGYKKNGSNNVPTISYCND
jgi:hypothetical protein